MEWSAHPLLVGGGGVSVGINDIHCHLLLEESKGQGVQRLAC